MPVGVDGGDFAGLVELRDLLSCEVPARSGQVLTELLFVARANNDRRHGWALQKPVQCDLGEGLARLLRNCIERVDYFVQVFVRDLRAHLRSFVEAADLGQRLVAADFAGKTAPAKRAPDEGSHF